MALLISHSHTGLGQCITLKKSTARVPYKIKSKVQSKTGVNDRKQFIEDDLEDSQHWGKTQLHASLFKSKVLDPGFLLKSLITN